MNTTLDIRTIIAILAFILSIYAIINSNFQNKLENERNTRLQLTEVLNRLVQLDKESIKLQSDFNLKHKDKMRLFQSIDQENIFLAYQAEDLVMRIKNIVSRDDLNVIALAFARSGITSKAEQFFKYSMDKDYFKKGIKNFRLPIYSSREYEEAKEVKNRSDNEKFTEVIAKSNYGEYFYQIGEYTKGKDQFDEAKKLLESISFPNPDIQNYRLGLNRLGLAMSQFQHKSQEEKYIENFHSLERYFNNIKNPLMKKDMFLMLKDLENELGLDIFQSDDLKKIKENSEEYK